MINSYAESLAARWGQEASKNNAPASANPYPEGERMQAAWLEGWRSAQRASCP